MNMKGIILIVMAFKLICSGTMTITITPDIVNIILLPEAFTFIAGYRNGTCTLKNQSFLLLKQITCCDDEMVALESIND